MKSHRIPSLAAALAVAAALAACQQQAPADQETAAAQKSATGQPAAPDAKPGMAVTDGELVLPAVTGRPGAVYFTLSNGSNAPVTLVSAHVEGAGNAEMHETSGGKMQAKDKVEIKPGETTSFARGGLHVMAFDLSSEFATGGTAELTLSFADGDKISAPLSISAMGTNGGMAGMDQEASH